MKHTLLLAALLLIFQRRFFQPLFARMANIMLTAHANCARTAHIQLHHAVL